MEIKAIIHIDIFFNEIRFIKVSPTKFYEKKCNFIHFYSEISFNLNNSTTALALPFTPNFCIVLEI